MKISDSELRRKFLDHVRSRGRFYNSDGELSAGLGLPPKKVVNFVTNCKKAEKLQKAMQSRPREMLISYLEKSGLLRGKEPPASSGDAHIIDRPALTSVVGTDYEKAIALALQRRLELNILQKAMLNKAVIELPISDVEKAHILLALPAIRI